MSNDSFAYEVDYEADEADAPSNNRQPTAFSKPREESWLKENSFYDEPTSNRKPTPLSMANGGAYVERTQCLRTSREGIKNE